MNIYKEKSPAAIWLERSSIGNSHESIFSQEIRYFGSNFQKVFFKNLSFTQIRRKYPWERPRRTNHRCLKQLHYNNTFRRLCYRKCAAKIDPHLLRCRSTTIDKTECVCHKKAVMSQNYYLSKWKTRKKYYTKIDENAAMKIELLQLLQLA